MSEQTTMTVDGDALAELREMAVRAARPQLLNIEGGPDHIKLYVGPDGVRERLVADPPLRDHELGTLAGLLAFCQATVAGKHEGQNPVLWLGPTKLRLVLNDVTRRDSASLALTFSEPLTLLMSGATGHARNQADFVRLLRIELAGTLPDAERLLALVRTIRFGVGDDGESVIQHGKESMGRSIRAEVHGLDVLPEEVVLNVRIYANPDIKMVRPIRCALDIIPASQQFRLVPLPMQIRDAIGGALDELEARARAELADHFPIYRGEN